MSRPAGLVAENIVDIVPNTNPFLKELLGTFLRVGGRKGKIDFDELGINEVVELLRNADMDAVLRDFGDRNPNEDPVIHFYELFLKEYDPVKRMKRGVFYTPRPVVSFIVRSVDEILRTEFGLEDGLADVTTWGEMAERHAGLEIPEGVSPEAPFVQILDPATGTGTFLVEVIEVIHKTMVEKWRKQGVGVYDVRLKWVERSNLGVVGMITNHTYLTGVIHRGMREELYTAFDSIRLLDLHGSALLGLAAPDGAADQSVFDIQQGVAISLLARRPQRPTSQQVRYGELWGTRARKYEVLIDLNFAPFQVPIVPISPHYLFVPSHVSDVNYDSFWSITQIFSKRSVGFVTGRDESLIAFDGREIRRLIKQLADANVSDEAIYREYAIGETSGWPIKRRRQDILQEGLRPERVRRIAYRPFDYRFTYFDNFLQRARYDTFRHLLFDNLAFITARLIKGEEPAHVFVARAPVEKIFLSPKTSNNAFAMPLYPHSSHRRYGSVSETMFSGLFPFFHPYVSVDQIDQVIPTLENIRSDFWADILKSMPREWGVSDDAMTAIDRFLLARARYLVDNLHAIAHRELSPQALDFGPEKETQDE